MQYVSRNGQSENETMIPDYTNSQICSLIDEHIHNERDRAILRRRLVDGICYEPLAEEFDISTTQVKRIIYKAQQKLIKHLN